MGLVDQELNIANHKISEENLDTSLDTENNENPESVISSLEKENTENYENPEAAVQNLKVISSEKVVPEKKNSSLDQFNEDIYNILIDDELLDHLVELDKNHVASIHKFKSDFLKFIQKAFYEKQQDKKLDQAGMTELLLKEFSSHIKKGAWPYFKQHFFTKYNDIINYLEDLDSKSQK